MNRVRSVRSLAANMGDMSDAIARCAVESVTGQRVDAVRALSSGRSSGAWLANVATEKWIARIPIEDSGRQITYRAESLIGDYLGSRGHRVARWTVVEIDGVSCSVARHLAGVPAAYGGNWSDEFGIALARILRELHAMPAQGFGPLANDDTNVLGISSDPMRGIVDRWRQAQIWPFDGSSLAGHPVVDQAPEIGRSVAGLSDEIEAAASGLSGVVHSDLHREHLLVGDDGSLDGVLDFGDAFIGAVAWDFALLSWYYGSQGSELVAVNYPNGNEELRRGVLLSVAVGLYKLAKNPADSAVLPRLRECFEAARSV